jgi:hypothetical protein
MLPAGGAYGILGSVWWASSLYARTRKLITTRATNEVHKQNTNPPSFLYQTANALTRSHLLVLSLTTPMSSILITPTLAPARMDITLVLQHHYHHAWLDVFGMWHFVALAMDSRDLSGTRRF